MLVVISDSSLQRELGLLSPTLSEDDHTNSLPHSPSRTHALGFSPPPSQALYFCTDLAVSNRLEVRSHGKPCSEILDRRTGTEVAEVTIDERTSEPHGHPHKESMGANHNFNIETSAEGPPVPRLGLSRKEVDAVGRERPPPREGGIEKGISGSWMAAKGLPPDGLEPLPLEPLPLEPQLLQPVTTYRGFTPTSEYSGSCSVELTERDSLVMWEGSPAPHEEVLNSQHEAVIKYGQVGLSCEAGPWPPRQALKSGRPSARASRTSMKSPSIFRSDLESNFANFQNILSIFSNVLEHSGVFWNVQNRLRRCLSRLSAARGCLRRSSPSKTLFHRLRRLSVNTSAQWGVPSGSTSEHFRLLHGLR